MRLSWLLAIVLAISGSLHAQALIVDHTSVALFERIPDEYIEAAANMRVMYANRSVGWNIWEGLGCLAYPTDESAPSFCRRYVHPVAAFSSSPSEVNWSRLEGYSRANWQFFGWPGSGIPPSLPCPGVSNTGSWYRDLECFVKYVDQYPDDYQVLSYMTSYLEVQSFSDIASATKGYFTPQPNRYDITEFEALQARHPDMVFLHHTSSLARSLGTTVSTSFNSQMRAYVRSHGGILFDVADIESHAPDGNACYDNRDGVPYILNGTVRENYPDDGQANPAICAHYTSEVDGGHLGNVSVGAIRLAKAWWVLMAQIAGWKP